MSIADQIQKRIDELCTNPQYGSPDERRIATALNALPIYAGWTGTIAIRPDTSLLFYNEDGNVKDYVEPEWQLTALIRGSKTYLELESLLPKRSTDASECLDCKGTGSAIIEGQQLEAIICGKCFGLGWVDKNINSLSEQVRARLFGIKKDA